MREIYNSWNTEYKSKFGAIKTGELCRFSICLPNDFGIDSNPVMIIFKNGFKERFLTMQEASRNDEYTTYTIEYVPIFMGVHYYYFGLMKHGVRFFIKRKGASIGTIGEGDLFQLTVYDSEFKTPEFLKGGMMYQIFPDRFYNSNTPKDNIPTDRYIHGNWGETPLYRPDCNGHVWNNDYFGGDLQGIIQKLDYIQSLGVTCIYLNPVFEAHENHRYNTADYMKIDPHLGTNEDFRELCQKASEKGISIILDGVFNHTGADSVYFNKFGRYDSEGAYNSKSSPYYSWYSFIDYPNVYESWWGIDTLPNVNEDNKSFSDFICGDQGVLKYWLSLGASGFRLDVADELPDEFLDRLNRSVKGASKENLIIGEVWEDASNKESYGVKRRYLLGQQLDSVMNYPFKDAIISYIKGGSPDIFRDWVMTILENYPKPSIDCLMNFLSTHDIMRAITAFGGDSPDGKGKDWQAEHYMSHDQYENGKSLFKCAMVLQFFLPGVPCVYYGDEVGLQGYGDPFNRRCFPWGNEDTELLEFVRNLSQLRQSVKKQLEGCFTFTQCTESMVSFIRRDAEKKSAVMIAINKSNNNITQHMSDLINEPFNNMNALCGQICEDYIDIPAKGFVAVRYEM